MTKHIMINITEFEYDMIGEAVSAGWARSRADFVRVATQSYLERIRTMR